MAIEALKARASARASDLAPITGELQAAGKTSLRAIACGLNEAAFVTARKSKWSAVQVQRVLGRMSYCRKLNNRSESVTTVVSGPAERRGAAMEAIRTSP